MKYLKQYSLFESAETKERVKYLKDIFQELVDKGYVVSIIDWCSFDGGCDNIECVIYKIFNNNSNVLDYFEMSDVKDSVLSAINYMESEGFSNKSDVHWSRNLFYKRMVSNSDWENTDERCNKIILRFSL